MPAPARLRRRTTTPDEHGRTMETYNFTLILDADPEQVEGPLTDSLFEAGCDDALLGTAEGVVHLDFDREAGSLVEAIASAIGQVESTGVRVVRIEPNDLVTLSEIGRRSGRSTESVRLLAEGKRGAGNFPRPVRGTREGPKLWKWVEVATWLAEHVAESLAAERPRRGHEARRAALQADLDRSRAEVEKARVIAAFNGGLAVRANAVDAGVADAVMAYLHEHQHSSGAA